MPATQTPARAVTRVARRAGWALTSVRDWMAYRARRAEFEAKTKGAPVQTIEAPLGHRTRHTFKIANGQVLTTFQMDQRWQIVARLYPERLTSLLDIGCCRGWFVIKAAMRPECERALGIDVVQGFIDAANEAKQILHLDNAQFEYGFIDDIAANPQKYHAPFQTIVLLNTYHYMYWGSEYSPNHRADHDYLLRMLSDLCTDRMLFMSPLEVADCPSDVVRRAEAHPEWAGGYTTENFLTTAGRYFDVTPEGYLGARPLYLMKKKTSSSGE